MSCSPWSASLLHVFTVDTQLFNRNGDLGQNLQTFGLPKLVIDVPSCSILWFEWSKMLGPGFKKKQRFFSVTIKRSVLGVLDVGFICCLWNHLILFISQSWRSFGDGQGGWSSRRWVGTCFASVFNIHFFKNSLKMNRIDGSQRHLGISGWFKI